MRISGPGDPDPYKKEAVMPMPLLYDRVRPTPREASPKMNDTDLPGLAFPQIDPVAICLGPLAIRWYALAYLAGILIGWRVLLRVTDDETDPIGRAPVDAMINAGVIGIILGGRLVYVLFYGLPYFLENPVEIPMIWRGGMSFHGGALGLLGAAFYVSRKYRVAFPGLMDLMVLVAPIGLFFGRIANFINAELYGRVTDVPWGMVFMKPQLAGGGACSGAELVWRAVPPGLPRHPSQIYEAVLEGLVLLALLWAVHRLGGRRRPWLMTGVFMAGYGLARFFVEFFREPDAQIGLVLGGAATMGQLLSSPMIAIGGALIAYALIRRPQP